MMKYQCPQCAHIFEDEEDVGNTVCPECGEIVLCDEAELDWQQHNED